MTYALYNLEEALIKGLLYILVGIYEKNLSGPVVAALVRY